ncbi:hypothetical protein CR492_00175 [Methylocella silvestris]|uniref:Uncharacterized protein n=1 Tax=Methylocella silvestris TaxID=199596 RepID=A0A2J7TKV9_METSI|nr:hypothetical protein CR492_00175 [Methylocella silvestris]
MTVPSFILKKLLTKMDRLQFLYDAGLIAPGSAECLDLFALKELQTQLLETADFVKSWNSGTFLQANGTQH